MDRGLQTWLKLPSVSFGPLWSSLKSALLRVLLSAWSSCQPHIFSPACIPCALACAPEGSWQPHLCSPGLFYPGINCVPPSQREMYPLTVSSRHMQADRNALQTTELLLKWRWNLLAARVPSVPWGCAVCVYWRTRKCRLSVPVLCCSCSPACTWQGARHLPELLGQSQ